MSNRPGGGTARPAFLPNLIVRISMIISMIISRIISRIFSRIFSMIFSRIIAFVVMTGGTLPTIPYATGVRGLRVFPCAAMLVVCTVRRYQI